jgi:hypothetical protein
VSGGPRTAAYLYGIVRAGFEPTSLTGIGDPARDVRAVTCGELAVLVSPADPDEVVGTRRDVLAHSETLRTVMEQTTVLPMRFGVILPSEDAVCTQLVEAHRDELLRLLRELEGQVQLTLKATYDEDTLMREIVAQEPEVAELREAVRGRPEQATYYERIRLGELVAAAVDRRRAEEAAALLDALRPHATAVVEDELQHERMVLNAAFLVRREGVEAFEAVAERLAAERDPRMRLRLLGPLAPHAFADFGEPAWA